MHISHGNGKKMEKWKPFVNKFIGMYNKTPHSGIKNYNPNAVHESKDKQTEVRMDKFEFWNKTNKRSKFQIGDFVHLKRTKGIFEKGYTQTFTNEEFQVVEVINSNPIAYKISDKDDKLIKGSFYDRELIKSQKRLKDKNILSQQNNITVNNGQDQNEPRRSRKK